MWWPCWGMGGCRFSGAGSTSTWSGGVPGGGREPWQGLPRAVGRVPGLGLRGIGVWQKRSCSGWNGRSTGSGGGRGGGTGDGGRGGGATRARWELGGGRGGGR